MSHPAVTERIWRMGFSISADGELLPTDNRACLDIPPIETGQGPVTE